MNEFSIHEQLKSEYTGKNDKTEKEVEGYYIDIVKKSGLVEIQTKNFLKIKPKLKKLLESHKVRLVHNIPQIKWIVKIDENGDILSRRKSPAKGSFLQIFNELIYLTDIIFDPNFSLEIVITEEEEIRQDDGKGSWRRKGVSIKDRKLVKIIDKKKFLKKNDYQKILPENLPKPFSTKDISAELKISVYLARKVVYCFRKVKLIKLAGKKGNLLLYKRNRLTGI
ncbi:MAG: hypothetical protein JW864_12560 [Spirochaetes bacterium]|nr:hypothetical protein [Spirochaetota bacterium]